VRKALSLVVVTALAVSLAACSSNPTASTSESPVSSSGACEATAGGAGVDGVTIDGEFGTKPTVTFDKPLTVTETERKVISTGDGDEIVDGDQVKVDFSLINATSGTELAATGYDATTYGDFTVGAEGFLPGLTKTMECATVGSRVVGVIPPVDAWGDSGQSTLGVAASDTIVFVVDLVSITPPLKVVPIADLTDMPTVTFSDTHEPTITIPAGIAAPPETKLGLITEGTGEVVPVGANVKVQYRGVIWATGQEFDSSWSRGAPSDFSTSGVVAGFGKAIEGQKVGSTIIAVIAPADGYGAAGNGDKIGPTDTIVFVIDVVAING